MSADLSSAHEGAAAEPKAKSKTVLMLVAGAAVILAGFLLYRTLSGYRWEEITASVAAIPGRSIALMIAFAAASYLCLTGFDWLALQYLGRPLPYRRAALASFCSLSLGHNIGLAALSSGAIRYRFYSRWGIPGTDIAKLVVFCGVTVGLGLVTLGGSAILLNLQMAARLSDLSRPVVLSIALISLLVPCAYLALAAFIRKPFRIWKWDLQAPSLPIAGAQIVIGVVNFGFVAACLYAALQSVRDLPYAEVALAYVLANLTSLISHVPGGLGVIETVVSHLIPERNIIGALIAFRAVYYLLALAIGAPLFALTELVLKARRTRAP